MRDGLEQTLLESPSRRPLQDGLSIVMVIKDRPNDVNMIHPASSDDRWASPTDDSNVRRRI
jgi:hypothetical protein